MNRPDLPIRAPSSFFPVEVTNVMALQGNIDSFSVEDVLRLLGSSSKTGRLVVEGDRGTASLWLRDGLVVAGGIGRRGPAVAAPVDDVVFELLKFVDGSFVFDADVAPGPSDAVSDGSEATATVDAVIEAARIALSEWDEICAVVPSLRCVVSLTVDLPAESVTVDRRQWSGIVGIAAAVETHRQRATVGDVADLLGLGELPAMRLVRDVVAAGLGEVGPLVDDLDMAPPSADDAPYEPAAYEPAAYEPAAYEPAAYEPSTYEPATFEPAAYEPAAYELVADDVLDGASAPTADGAGIFDAPPPIGNIGAAEPFDAFEAFDPFGTAAAAPPPSATDEVVGAATDGPEVDPVDEAAQQAEFARQLAMLSPRAAEAVASAEAGPSTEEEERARVARFLGSV